jgi:hypothetical protein
MKHNFTDEQLSDAYKTALGQGSPGDTVADYIRATLDNLPDPEPELEATGQPHDFWTINSAIVKASEEYPQLRGLEVVPVAAILSYLPDPEPDDEWQQHDVRSVRKGDRVRWTVPGSEDNESYEIVVAAVTNEDGVVLDSESHSYYFPYGAIVDRIPAPVQHPNPEVHDLILLRDSEHGHEEPVVALWHGGEYKYTDDHGTPQYLYPHQITDWSPIDPAKVVEDDR